MTYSRRCPCGSRKLYSNCCERYLGTLRGLGFDPRETALLDWLQRSAPPTAREFMRKARTYIFRISWLLECLLQRYFDFPVVQKNERLESKDEPMCWIEHNTLLSLFGALSCIEQGLFVQSGILLRSVLENCFVLVDLSENKEQMKKFLQDKYSVNGLLGRTKSSLPDCLVDWYGYFSRNFAHFGPIHPAPYLPRLCWPDNWVDALRLEWSWSVCIFTIQNSYFFGSSTLIVCNWYLKRRAQLGIGLENWVRRLLLGIHQMKKRKDLYTRERNTN